MLDNDKNIVFDVDVVGGLNLKEYFGRDSLSIFIDVPSSKDLKSRLNKRGTDSENKIKERLEKAKVEISQKDRFDVIIMNSDIKKACKDILDVVIKFISV